MHLQSFGCGQHTVNRVEYTMSSGLVAKIQSVLAESGMAYSRPHQEWPSGHQQVNLSRCNSLGIQEKRAIACCTPVLLEVWADVHS